MSCRTVNAVALARERQVRGRVRVEVGAKAALRDSALMLPPSGIFTANATRLKLATIALNLSCVVGMFTDSDSDSDSDHDLYTARSLQSPYPRQFSHVAA